MDTHEFKSQEMQDVIALFRIGVSCAVFVAVGLLVLATVSLRSSFDSSQPLGTELLAETNSSVVSKESKVSYSKKINFPLAQSQHQKD
jgi:hypothetical protein